MPYYIMCTYVLKYLQFKKTPANKSSFASRLESYISGSEVAFSDWDFFLDTEMFPYRRDFLILLWQSYGSLLWWIYIVNYSFGSQNDIKFSIFNLRQIPYHLHIIQYQTAEWAKQ